MMGKFINKLKPVWAFLKKMWTLDIRSIALWRMLAGGLLVLDVIMKWDMLPVLYSDYGLIRNEFWTQINPHPEYWTIHLGNSTKTFAYVMGVLQMIVGASLAVGIKTRMNAVLAWILIASGVGRIPYLISGADNMLRILLFWTMFLPLGKVWSLDTKLKTGAWFPEGIKTEVTSAAAFCYVIQITWIYVSAVWWKTNEVWLLQALDGMTPVYRTLSLDSFRSGFGDVLYQFPGLLKMLGIFTLFVQYSAPLFLLFPLRSKRNWMRLIGVFFIFSLQFGFLITMKLGIFPWVGMLSVSALLPALIWKQRPEPLFISEEPQSNWYEKMLFYGKKLVSIGLVALIVSVVVWDVEGHINSNRGSTPYQHLAPMKVKKFGMALMLNQNWKMFDRPALIDAWVRMPGETILGEKVDVWQTFIHDEVKPPIEGRPEVLRDEFPNNRWRKTLRGLDDENSHAWKLRRELFAGYLCRWWSDTHKAEHGRLKTFEMHWYKERTEPNYETKDLGYELYGQYSCDV